jgi:hypothetical protein
MNVDRTASQAMSASAQNFLEIGVLAVMKPIPSSADDVGRLSEERINSTRLEMQWFS